MKYLEQRNTAPKKGDPFWTSTANGGKSPCYVINKSSGDTLPNCVGYAWGRCYEAWGVYPPWLPVNAENIINNLGGLKTGTEPKLGAIMLWRKGRAGDSSDGMGHVEFVERIYANGDVLTSASNYGGSRFYLSRRTKASGYSLGYAYVFQGFAYAPTLFTDRVGEPVKRDPARDQVKINTDILNARRAPGINSERIGYIEPGIYNVYETASSGEYKWARVDSGQTWIAMGADWSEYYPAVRDPLYSIRFTDLTAEEADYLADIGDVMDYEYEVSAV